MLYNPAKILRFCDAEQMARAVRDAKCIVGCCHRFIRIGMRQSPREVSAPEEVESYRRRAEWNKNDDKLLEEAGDRLRGETWEKLSQWREAFLFKNGKDGEQRPNPYFEPHGFMFAGAAEAQLKDAVGQLLFLGKHDPTTSFHSLSESTTRAVDGLAQTAGEGSEWAFRNLLTIAESAVKALAMASDKNPDLARGIAETCATWPSFIGPHGDTLAEREKILNTLNVGAKSPLRVKKPSRNKKDAWSNKVSPGQSYRNAIGLYIERLVIVLQEHRRRYEWIQLRYHHESEGRKELPAWLFAAVDLPPLTEQGATKLWFEAAWELLLAVSKGKPQTLSGLAGIGQARVGSFERNHPGEKISPRREAAESITALKERMGKAFRQRYGEFSLARQASA